MATSKLKMMVNQIDQNMPFAGVKSELIATHLKKFWTPQMRAEIYAEVQAMPDDFSSDVRDALSQLHKEAKA